MKPFKSRKMKKYNEKQRNGRKNQKGISKSEIPEYAHRRQNILFLILVYNKSVKTFNRKLKEKFK